MASSTLFRGSETLTSGGLERAPRRIGRSSLLWLDVGRDAGELRRAAVILELEERTIRAIGEAGSEVAALHDLGTYTHVTAVAPADGARDAELARIDCVVGERWVLTAHERPVAVLDEFRERAEGTGATGELDGPAFLAALLEWVLGEYERAFAAIEENLDELDVRTLAEAPDDPERELKRLVELRRDIGSLRRALAGHREPFLALTHPELERISTPDSARRFAGLVNRLDATLQAGRDARSAVAASFDVLMARTEHRTNEILKVLTLASVLFLPGSLAAALLGMNFRVGLFDHAAGFWIVVAAVVLGITATTMLARRRGWV